MVNIKQLSIRSGGTQQHLWLVVYKAVLELVWKDYCSACRYLQSDCVIMKRDDA